MSTSNQKPSRRGDTAVECVVSCPPFHLSLSPSLCQVGPSSGAGKANGHISRWLVPLRRLGGCEVIPSLLFPFTSGSIILLPLLWRMGNGWGIRLESSIHLSIHSRASFQCHNQPQRRNELSGSFPPLKGDNKNLKDSEKKSYFHISSLWKRPKIACTSDNLDLLCLSISALCTCRLWGPCFRWQMGLTVALLVLTGLSFFPLDRR